MQPKYELLSEELTRRIQEDRANRTSPQVGFDNNNIIRRFSTSKDKGTVWRPPFTHDLDKILHCPYYNRYTDKTQVFSLIKNDDITRRSLHVQLVSRIARTIGSALNLNLDLIEAIALGHDLGHPPFAHSGEKFLNELYFQHTGRYFCHNIHSIRVLDKIFPFNISLQTLDGIACHNGEVELEAYEPSPLKSFEEFDEMIEHCYTDRAFANKIYPSTLEGCVVRISDIIAYLGKDRQDAAKVHLVDEESFPNEGIGSINAEIINNLVVNIIENSYGKPYIKMDAAHFNALKSAKKENYARIYENSAMRTPLGNTVKPMMAELYDRLLQDIKEENKTSPIYLHHIDYVNQAHYVRQTPYEATDPNQLVVDFIASMTDDYFIDLYRYLFPDSPIKVEYKGYFD